ncbi:MAG: hypothetical protein ACJ796_08950 [Gemmatimonadaceae bacterium]
MTTPHEATQDSEHPTTKKPAAKRAPKKGNGKKPAPKRDDRRTSAAGDALVALAKKAGDAKGASTVTTLGAKLGDGITHAQLVSLRDAVKALAAIVRPDKPALARDLADANRAVRRAERASR